ncbi:unnamed protein product [Cunninghamella blakesleeana]
MPGIITEDKFPTASNDMTMFESYMNLETFLDQHRRLAHHFTIDNDNHGVGILCCHKYTNSSNNHNNNHNEEERSAMVVRLDKEQIRQFMTSYGFTVTPNNQGSTFRNPTFSTSGYICQLPS